MDNINQLKVKGLVLGPLHTVQAGMPETLDLQDINPNHGTKEALLKVIEKATRKGSFSNLQRLVLVIFIQEVYLQDHFSLTITLHSRHLRGA